MMFSTFLTSESAFTHSYKHLVPLYTDVGNIRVLQKRDTTNEEGRLSLEVDKVNIS